jgi:hypothetical protein
VRNKNAVLFATFIVLLLLNIIVANKIIVNPLWPAYVIHIYFLAFGLISIKILSNKTINEKRFITYFMGITAAKLFTALILLIIILLIEKSHKIFWAASFGVAYIVALFQEVMFNLKRKS